MKSWGDVNKTRARRCEGDGDNAAVHAKQARTLTNTNTHSNKGSGLFVFGVMADRELETVARGPSSKSRVDSGLPAITGKTRHTVPLDLNRDGLPLQGSVSTLVKTMFHTCNFGLDQTKEARTTMISSVSALGF